MVRTYGKTLNRVKYSLLTIAAMLALGYTTKGAGLDSTLGLAFAHAGWFYPFFGAMLGWLGVALTGLALAALMGVLIMAQAYVWPFTALVVH